MKKIFPLLSLCCLSSISFAQTDSLNTKTKNSPTSETHIEEVSIIGSRDDLRTLSGSATLLDNEAIERFDASDINDLLNQVPGVYIRYEDGYGLRPNIGIRGVTSDRSQKITLMEDGILIAPAPYSAPAAYYFPNINRMERVEIVKGPSAIKHGPHTIGGAINMVTPSVPDSLERQISLSVGSDNFQKIRATIGDTFEQWGYSFDVLRYSADGFKELDTGGDTGFERNDINAKIRWQSSPDSRFKQTLTFKLGYADEVSDETYLGLSDADFRAQPNRRYAASQLDEFTSDHKQFHALHTIELNSGVVISSQVYTQIFNRAWNKFDAFTATSLPAQDVLANPELFPTRFGLLTGEVSSNANPNLRLDLTNNDRTYGSRGIATTLTYPLATKNISHKLTAGVRYHHDYVERNHTVRGYFSEQSQLVFDGINDRRPNALNTASSDAVAIYLQNIMTINQWEITLGARYENIEGELDDTLNNTTRSRSQDIFMPGLGAHFQLTPSLGLLAGVNKGFSPAGPSSNENVEPEEAINYEYGFRYQANNLETDVIGFYSDYSNLIGRCRASDFGCEVGDEFNGGEINISGFELTSRYIASYKNLTLPMSVVYTYTESAFQSSFDSSFSQWGRVNAGDELPYLPENQLRFEASLETSAWLWTIALKHNDQMRETPGQGDSDDSDIIKSYTTIDLSTAWQVTEQLKLQLIAENITDKQEIVARRPFGARPNQPRIVKAGLTYRF